MSLYNHVADKDDLLVGMVESVVGEIPEPSAGRDWRASLRATILAARTTLLRHPGRRGVIESRPRTWPRYAAPLRYGHRHPPRGRLLARPSTHHALHLLGSRVLGFSQDLYDDSGT